MKQNKNRIKKMEYNDTKMEQYKKIERYNRWNVKNRTKQKWKETKMEQK